MIGIAKLAYLTFPMIDATAIVVTFRLLCAVGLSTRSSMLGALGPVDARLPFCVSRKAIITGLFAAQLQIEVNKFLYWDAANSSLAPFALDDPLSGRLSRRVVQLVWRIFVLLDGVCLILFIRRVSLVAEQTRRTISWLRAPAHT